MSIPAEKLEIGRALLAGGPLTVQGLQRELESSGKQDSVLGKALLQSGFPQEQDLIVPILQRLRIPKINAKNTKIPLDTIRVLPEAVAKAHKVLAIDVIGNILVVVTPTLNNVEGLTEVRRATGMLVTPIQCSDAGFEGIINDYYGRLSAAGMSSATPVLADAGSTSSGGGGGAPASNGVLQAIEAGDDNEDEFFKRYMSAGPVVAEETLM